MTGRHRPVRRSSARTTVLVAVVAVLAVGAVLVVQSLADAGGCSDRTGIRLPVAADPAIAPALREAADQWIRTDEPELAGRCLAVDVTAVPSAELASQLATAAGGFVDVATPAPAVADLPAVWVPESSYWIEQLRGISRTMFDSPPASLASSPIALAASPAAADLLGSGPVQPADLRAPVLDALAAGEPSPVRLAEPRRDIAGLVGAGWLQQATVAAQDELPNLVAAFRGIGDAPPDAASLLAGLPRAAEVDGRLLLAPASEQTVAAHNLAAGATELATLPVLDAAALDYPYAVLASAPRDLRTAATMLRAALLAAPDRFEAAGFRPPAPTSPLGSPEQLRPVLRIWASATRDARVLSVVNVNTSMAEPMGEARRIDVFRATAEQGLALFTEGSELGHWEYADQWTEGVPIATLTEEHRQEVLAAIAGMQVRPTNQAALFETLLAAYRELKDGYDRDRSNTLIMWTDGGNRQPGGLTLEETLRELERLADLTRPIRVILLGLGPDADMGQLAEIARVTGGGAFHLVDPDEIAQIFLQALLT